MSTVANSTSTSRLTSTNIILLQNLIKRDPDSYREEFLQQLNHYATIRDIFLLSEQTNSGSSEQQQQLDLLNDDDEQPVATNVNTNFSTKNIDNQIVTDFAELIGFIASVCQCYPKETETFPLELKTLVIDYYSILNWELKEKIIISLTMMKNKKFITPELLIGIFFPILLKPVTLADATHSKLIKTICYDNLVQLLRNANNLKGKKKDVKLNKATQALCFNMLENGGKEALWACKLTKELWLRGIWDDSRTVEIMTLACTNADLKIFLSGVQFFLGADKERDDLTQQLLNDDDDEEEDLASLRHRLQINKKSGKRAKKMSAAVSKYNKKQKKLQSHQMTNYLNFSAIHLLRDPQTFAERLFVILNQGMLPVSKQRLQLNHKIYLMQLISRMVGSHKLMVFGIYTYFLKYLTPKQQDVTKILASAANSCHDLVPPENITVMVKKIANEFISEGVSSEVCAVGLNTVREILTRQPLGIEGYLLQDLIEYKDSKNKSVVNAAKGLLSLYREIAPEMLKKKDRGKLASLQVQQDNKETDSTETNMEEFKNIRFGQDTAANAGIDEGFKLLSEWKENEGKVEENEDDQWSVESRSSDEDGDDIEGDWINIESDKEYDVNMDSSDEEKEDKKPKDKNNEPEDLSKLLGTKILTPQDFAKMEELKREAGVSKLMGLKKVAPSNDQVIEDSSLFGLKTHYRATKEEKLAKIKEGREGRKDYGSGKGKHKNGEQKSTTNREKSRKKNFVMMIHKRDVKGKQKISMRDKQRLLKAHIDKQKKKGF
ncbi:hypothetical protein FOG50_02161 [Hanseniaspora uvarum]|nr:hypothetical protein FOG48_01962 [Hanseniaspora uvarum]KAF0276971.1 hypothetical protein FOG50_02161 [Hanseniaspora uvarum]GMM39946.1 Sda1 protein [Hanseniaspora uvarum]